jgi:hypothetical protein
VATGDTERGGGGDDVVGGVIGDTSTAGVVDTDAEDSVAGNSAFKFPRAKL